MFALSCFSLCLGVFEDFSGFVSLIGGLKLQFFKVTV